MQHFVLWVDPSDSTNFVKVTGGCLLHHLITIVRITPVAMLLGLGVQDVDHFRKGHFIRFPDPHVDDFRPRVGIQSSLLGTLDFLKFIDCRGFTILVATNALSEKILDVGFFCHMISSPDVAFTAKGW